MANPMEVLHVMTPAEWGTPIDVDEEWIHFVDENVKASKSTEQAQRVLVLNAARTPTMHGC